MASVLCDVNLWLEHAKEVRALCEVISDPEEKEQMMEVAVGFDRIAELAKEQAMLQKAKNNLFSYRTLAFSSAAAK